MEVENVELQVPKHLDQTIHSFSKKEVIFGSGFALCAIGWIIVNHLIKSYFKDKTEISRTAAEVDIIELLKQDGLSLREEKQKLHEKIDKISEERNQAVAQLGRFTVEIELYKEQASSLKESVLNMTQRLEEQNVLLRNVLVENAQLKAQVDHLIISNQRLSSEISELEDKIVQMKNGKT